MRDMLITEEQKIHARRKSRAKGDIFNMALKHNMPLYAFFHCQDRRSERKEKTLAVHPTPIVKPASRSASNDERVCVQGQLRLPSFSSHTE